MYNFADHATQPHPPTAIAPIGRSVGRQSGSQAVRQSGSQSVGQAGRRARGRVQGERIPIRTMARRTKSSRFRLPLVEWNIRPSGSEERGVGHGDGDGV